MAKANSRPFSSRSRGHQRRVEASGRRLLLRATAHIGCAGFLSARPRLAGQAAIPGAHTWRSYLALILGAHNLALITRRRGSSAQRFAGGIWALARLPDIKVATRCGFVRAVCFTRPFERGELRNQTSKSSQQRCASGWFAEVSCGLLTAESPFDAARTVAKAVSIVDNGSAKVAIRPTQAAAEIIAAILLIMTSSHS